MKILVCAVVLISLLVQSSAARFGCIFKFFSSSLSNRCNYCRDTWIESDFVDLERDMKAKLFGQHIAQVHVPRYLKAHLINSSPKKALALSFHGTTGCGKNYIMKISIDRLMYYGMDNIFVQYWNTKHHFSDQRKIATYKTTVYNTIFSKLKECPRSVFIFDEANKLPAGLLDILAPMMEEHAKLDGQDFTKAIFIFLSNTGATKINHKVVKHTEAKKHRNALRITDFQDLIQTGAYTEEGGFHGSELLKKNIIDCYVPFLPLGREQVRLCIKYFLNSRECPISEQVIKDLVEEVNYEPDKDGFSAYGCRGLDALIKNNVDHQCVLKSPKTEL